MCSFCPRLLFAAAWLALAAACTRAEAPEQPLPAPAIDDGLLEDEPGDPNVNDVIDTAGAHLRKGVLGSASGQGDFCDNALAPCVATEGDCDNNSQCTGGTVCTADNGGRYAGQFQNQQDDHCAPASCSNRTKDGTETETDCGNLECGACDTICDLPDGHNDRCTYHCPCPARVGDCDAHDNCKSWDDPILSRRNVCVADVGGRFGLTPTTDVCLPSHCNNRIQDAGESSIDCGDFDCGPCSCPSTVPGSECTPSCPCAAGGGDCDTNLDCRQGLVCREEGAVDACRSTVVELASSEAEFSGVQGQNSWFYGFYPGSNLTPSGFQQLELFLSYWRHVNFGQPWTLVDSAGGHPNGAHEPPPGLELAVRRWVSEHTGTVRIQGRLWKTNVGCGDGVGGQIIRGDGAVFFSATIGAGDGVGITYDVTVPVVVGQTIDFAITPLGVDFCDSTGFSSVITAL